jgi:hypothetical protein
MPGDRSQRASWYVRLQVNKSFSNFDHLSSIFTTSPSEPDQHRGRTHPPHPVA